MGTMAYGADVRVWVGGYSRTIFNVLLMLFLTTVSGVRESTIFPYMGTYLTYQE